MSRIRKTPDQNVEPLKKRGEFRFPDRGERVFVPSFKTMGTVIEICPRINAGDTAASAIFYLVEMDVTRTPNRFLQEDVVRFEDRSLFLAEELEFGELLEASNRELSSGEPARLPAAKQKPDE